VYAALGQVWLQIAEQRHDRPDALGKALEALSRVASTTAATSEVLTRYGHVLVKVGQMEAADRVLQRATALFPVAPGAFREYAFVAEHFNRLPAARTAMLQYNALVPEDEQAPRRAYQIAIWSLRLHDPTTAVGWLKRAARADAGDAAFMLDVADA